MKIDDQIKLTQDTLTALMTVKDDGVPDGWVLEYRSSDESWQLSAGLHGVAADLYHYRLRKLPDPPKPRKVPLEFADVPPGSVFSQSTQNGWFPATVKRKGIRFESNGSFVELSWEEMQSARLHIHRPGQDWQLCEKDAE